MLMADTRRRVKVYVLNEERQWDDKGTGHVSSTLSEGSVLSLVVQAEDDGTLLLESKVQQDTAYHKQCETLIVWSENDNTELALSFQERAGCDEIWEKICQVQGKDPATTTITQDTADEEEEAESERFEDLPDAATPIDLPMCELSRLFEIREVIEGAMSSPIRRERLAIALQSESYIPQLVEIFHVCEDLENTEDLHRLFDIFKSIFLLNKNSIFEIMFTEDLIFEILGILEYDPHLLEPASHREFIRDKAQFKEVVPFSNPVLLDKIHQTYRVQYIQDVVSPTPSVFEDNMLSTLSSFIFLNKADIVTMLQEDDVFLQRLFEQLQDEKLETSTRIDLACLLREFCNFSNTLQVQGRTSFLRSLANKRLFPTLEFLLAIDVVEIWGVAADILSFSVDNNPSLVRDFMVQEATSHDEDALLINIVIERIVNHAGCNAEGTLLGLLRTLIDPENMLRSLNRMEKSEFLAFFYKYAMHRFTEPIMLATHGSECLKYISKSENFSLIGSVLDVLSFAVENHTYHVKNYILSKELLQKVLLLMNPRYSFLALNALKFIRKIIGLKDEFYNRYIIKYDLFQHIVDAYCVNGLKHNMLNSASLEMFEFIKIEDIKSLVKYLCEKHIDQLLAVEPAPTFKALKLKYEQQLDRQSSTKGEGMLKVLDGNARFRRDDRDLDRGEEAYFNDDDNDDFPEKELQSNKSLFKSSVVVQAKVLDTKPPPNKVIGNDGNHGNKVLEHGNKVLEHGNKVLGPLVDYPEDSDDDEEEALPSNKRQKVSSTVT